MDRLVYFSAGPNEHVAFSTNLHYTHKTNIVNLFHYILELTFCREFYQTSELQSNRRPPKISVYRKLARPGHEL